MDINVHHFQLKLKTPFSIHHGSYNHRESIIIEIKANGKSGFGETVAIDYYHQQVDEMLEVIKENIVQLNKWDIRATTDEFYQQLVNEFPNQPFITCALDCAYWDLKARLNNQSIQQYAHLPTSTNTLSSITIGKNEEATSVKEKLTQEWPIIKYKYNAENWEATLNKIIAQSKQIGIDANGGLTVTPAKQLLEYLDKHKGLYLEQPFGKKENNLMDNIKNRYKTPILADESIQTMADFEKLKDLYDGFVLKLTKCGGITPVLQLADHIKSHNKLILLGCMTESSVGISNMSELLSIADFADLDGAALIDNDPFEGTKLLENGKIITNTNRVGNGIRWKNK